MGTHHIECRYTHLSKHIGTHRYTSYTYSWVHIPHLSKHIEHIPHLSRYQVHITHLSKHIEHTHIHLIKTY